MPDAKDVSQEAGKVFVETIQKQCELLGSWALAVFGASVLLVVWYAQRRMDASKPVPVRALWLVIACGIFQGLSILAMYLAYGAIVNVIPDLYFAKIDGADSFYAFTTAHGFPAAQYLLQAQFYLFFGGLVLMGFFALVNRPLIRP